MLNSNSGNSLLLLEMKLKDTKNCNEEQSPTNNIVRWFFWYLLIFCFEVKKIQGFIFKKFGNIDLKCFIYNIHQWVTLWESIYCTEERWIGESLNWIFCHKFPVKMGFVTRKVVSFCFDVNLSSDNVNNTCTVLETCIIMK